MNCSETGYTLYVEAPEPTEAELDEMYLDALEQSAPIIEWPEFEVPELSAAYARRAADTARAAKPRRAA